jgi:hypothetical protein
MKAEGGNDEVKAFIFSYSSFIVAAFIPAFPSKTAA